MRQQQHQAGNIDIAYSYSPFSDKANAAQKDGRTIYSFKQMPTAIADLYIFNTKFIQTNPKAVAVRRKIQGLEFLENKPQRGFGNYG
jgi:NitT/TauT family transport system substrate-binding protein